VRERNGKGFIRLKLVQGIGLAMAGGNAEEFVINDKKSYHVLSEDFRLWIPNLQEEKYGDESSRDSKVEIQVPSPITFRIAPLLSG